jgi:hypothetical protein
MAVDWREVERSIEESLEVLSYAWVREHYNHNMSEAAEYATRLLGGDPKQRYGDRLARLKSALQQLDYLGIEGYVQFVQLVDTRDKLGDFFGRVRLPLDEIANLLHYLLHWVLPSKIYLRQLIDREDKEALAHVTALGENEIRLTLDILEHARTGQQRVELSARTGVPERFLYELANRADMTRMPYVSGNTVRHYFEAGCTSLKRLATEDPNVLEEQVAAYFDSIGRNWKRAVDLEAAIQIAKVLPKVIEH